jgi:hypothetical protein
MLRVQAKVFAQKKKKNPVALKDDEHSISIFWYLFYSVYDEDVSQHA